MKLKQRIPEKIKLEIMSASNSPEFYFIDEARLSLSITTNATIYVRHLSIYSYLYFCRLINARVLHM